MAVPGCDTADSQRAVGWLIGASVARADLSWARAAADPLPVAPDPPSDLARQEPRRERKRKPAPWRWAGCGVKFGFTSLRQGVAGMRGLSLGHGARSEGSIF